MRSSNKQQFLFGKIKEVPFYFHWISEFFHKSNIKESNKLSDQTCDDLDFEELFMFLDRTNSSVGQQYFYYQLRTISKDATIKSEDEVIIDEIANNLNFRKTVEDKLRSLNSTEAYYISKLFQEKSFEVPRWYKLLPILTLMTLFSLIGLLIFPDLIYIIPFLLIANMWIHYRNKNNLDYYISALPELVKLYKVSHFFTKKYPNYFAKQDISKSLHEIKKMKKHFYLFQMENRLQGDVTTILWGLLELFKISLLLEPILFRKLITKLNTNKLDIKNLHSFIGKLDMLYSVSSLRSGLNTYSKPDFHNQEFNLIAKGIYHPLIPDCIKNDINTSGKSVLLTGSNMSGKTTFIRTIGINLITALNLNTCFADSIQLPFMNLLSAIRISDDLMNDKSYYFEEVATIKNIIENSYNESYSLILLDEIFKGTNTVERISAGKAVLSYLSKKNNLIFVSTHDIELADLLKNEFNLFHFNESIENDKVSFDYKLKQGKVKTRNAINILKLSDYPDEIIKDAFSTVKSMESKF
ncbi:MutS-related protein [Marivirga arenosa]|uniref:DNA mismatch repair protein MutS n=1 Tax=Marivirga arenosa TaxID=3059076 RepID=A0AA49GJA9_9BACT|nr:DNA mismatch repair protein MutS [Marivirga sp. BKB1-2]WKK81656.2 DNA mismatch repair protein MutS [Marivirga sp. BKB1-2]